MMLLASAALAQDQRPGLFGNLFNRGEERAQQQQGGQAPQLAQADNADISMRLDRVENALRQLTGTIEDLQHRNQQLEMRLQRLQDDTEYRFQQMGSRGGSAPRAMPQSGPPGAPLNTRPDQRSDAFDPNAHPSAPGTPRVLGREAAMAPQAAGGEASIGAPGGRAAGAPLDLTTLSNDMPQTAAAGPGPAYGTPVYGAPVPAQPPPGQSQTPPPSTSENSTDPSTSIVSLAGFGRILRPTGVVKDDLLPSPRRPSPEPPSVPEPGSTSTVRAVRARTVKLPPGRRELL